MDLSWLVFAALLVLNVVAMYMATPYLKSLSGEVGKIHAIQQNVEQVREQAMTKAYAEEFGKRVATHDDIENVFRELHRITLDTETIKTHIAANEWNRQWLRTKKTEMYITLLQLANQIQSRLSVLVGILEMSDDGSMKEESEAAWQQFQSLLPPFRQARATADLFASEEASKALQDAISAFGGRDMSRANPPIQVIYASFKESVAALLVAARRDLQS